MLFEHTYRGSSAVASTADQTRMSFAPDVTRDPTFFTSGQPWSAHSGGSSPAPRTVAATLPVSARSSVTGTASTPLRISSARAKSRRAAS